LFHYIVYRRIKGKVGKVKNVEKLTKFVRYGPSWERRSIRFSNEARDKIIEIAVHNLLKDEKLKKEVTEGKEISYKESLKILNERYLDRFEEEVERVIKTYEGRQIIKHHKSNVKIQRTKREKTKIIVHLPKNIRESRSLKEILKYKFAHTKKRIVKHRSRGKIVRNKHRKIRTAKQSRIKRTLKRDIKKREEKKKLIRKLKRIHREKRRKLRREHIKHRREHRKQRKHKFWTKKVEIDHSLKLSERIKLLKKHYKEFLNNKKAYDREIALKGRACNKNRKDARIAIRRAKRRFIRNLKEKKRFERIKRRREERKLRRVARRVRREKKN